MDLKWLKTAREKGTTLLIHCTHSFPESKCKHQWHSLALNFILMNLCIRETYFYVSLVSSEVDWKNQRGSLFFICKRLAPGLISWKLRSDIVTFHFFGMLFQCVTIYSISFNCLGLANFSFNVNIFSKRELQYRRI